MTDGINPGLMKLMALLNALPLVLTILVVCAVIIVGITVWKGGSR